MLELNIDSEEMDPKIKKINVDGGAIIVEYSEDLVNHGDEIDDIVLKRVNLEEHDPPFDKATQEIVLFRFDPYNKGDCKKQKRLCGKLITALQYVEKNWF
jgi:hypothetical protein